MSTRKETQEAAFTRELSVCLNDKRCLFIFSFLPLILSQSLVCISYYERSTSPIPSHCFNSIGVIKIP